MKKYLKMLLVIMGLLVLTLVPKDVLAADSQYTDNLIPAMKSNTSPSGTASASSNYNSTYEPYRAFDHTSGAWIAGNKLTSGWLQYAFAESKIIAKYTLTPRLNTDETSMPKDWTFEAYDENSGTWIILDTQRNITWSKNTRQVFTFNNANSYKIYRINISSTNGWPTIQIGELEMMASLTPQVSAPTNLVAIVADKQVILTWAAVNGTTSYTVKRSETPSGPYIDITSKSPIISNTFVDSDNGLAPGKTYYYVVTAIINGTESSNSNEASVSLKAPTSLLKLVLEINQEQQLSIHDDLAENLNMNWTSSNTSIATVDANGNVKALKPGTTLITCTSPDGSYTNTIKVLVVKTITLAIDLKVGKTCLLTVDDLTNTIKVTWVSGDQSVATISTTGKVTAISKGLTLITAYDDQGNEIDHVYIRVRE